MVVSPDLNEQGSDATAATADADPAPGNPVGTPVPVSELSATPAMADTVEALLAGAVAAPASLPAISSQTVIAGRFTVERLLGVGGMGAVYLARDRVLGRPVALKLHRTVNAATRLHREAIAMARLAHPNVVTVFEVGHYEERPFVAMEYVEGQTLRGWLTTATPTRTQILDALLAAGEGLAAAHDAELVHRDVKPDNILIGEDGRVRIGDFGLAQAAAAGDGPVDAALTPLCATGTVVGTPGYMAPEQLDGAVIDARTDQFAFCVVAWEALCAARPFDGADTRELRAAIERGVPRADRAKLPPRFRRVLARGLAVEPAARWPSMRALLAALRVARRRPAVIASGVAGAGIAIGIAMWALWPAYDPVAACSEAVAPFDRELPVATTDTLLAQVRAAGGPEIEARATAIGRVLDRQRVVARSVAVSACRARASRQWSTELAQASMECLVDHARTVKEIIGALPASRTSAADLVVITGGLPEVAPCGDARILAGWQPLAAAPDRLPATIAARGRIEAAIAQLGVGRVAGAAAIVDELDRGSVSEMPAVRREMALLRGMLQIARGDIADGERRLTDAYFAARAADDGALVLRIVAELIHVVSALRRDADSAESWIRNGLADAEREQVRHPSGASAVYLRAATAATLAGDGERALERLDRSEALRASVPAAVDRGASFAVRSDALALLGRTDDALAASDRYLALLRAAFGGHHPIIAEALSGRAALLLEADRDEPAAAAAREAKAIIDAEGDAATATIASVELDLGATLLQLGDPAARGYLENARTIWVRMYGEDHPDVALADTNLALLYLDAGETERALAALRHAVAVTEKTIGADNLELGAPLYNLAVAERQAGDLDAALATARRAAAIYERKQTGSVRHVFALGHIAMILNLANQPAEALAVADGALAMPMLGDEPTGPAWLRLESARSLITLRRELPRARQLLARARAAYQGANVPQRVREIDALRATAR